MTSLSTAPLFKYCPCLFQTSLVVSTVDRRKQPLVFKGVIYELKSDLLLVEFRRSKVHVDRSLNLCKYLVGLELVFFNSILCQYYLL